MGDHGGKAPIPPLLGFIKGQSGRGAARQGIMEKHLLSGRLTGNGAYRTGRFRRPHQSGIKKEQKLLLFCRDDLLG